MPGSSVPFPSLQKSQTISGLHASGSSSIPSNHPAHSHAALFRSRAVSARAHRVWHFGLNRGTRPSHYVAGGRCRALPWILARYAAQLPDSRAVDHRSYSRLCRVLFSGLFFHFRRFLNATVHLVIFALVVRLFSARRERDYYFLAAIAFLMVLAAAVLTVGSMFLLTFSGFMLVAAVAVILMEMRHAAAKSTVHANESRDELAHRHMAFSLAGASPVLVLFILLGAAGIFFLLPRISAGYFSAYAPGGDLTTGFSDRVQLGQIGQIQQSRSVVMHIQIDGDEHGGFDLKWRS